jgi:hypothetical protein
MMTNGGPEYRLILLDAVLPSLHPSNQLASLDSLLVAALI